MVEVPDIIWGGFRDYMVCKPILVFLLSLSQAEQFFLGTTSLEWASNGQNCHQTCYIIYSLQNRTKQFVEK